MFSCSAHCLGQTYILENDSAVVPTFRDSKSIGVLGSCGAVGEMHRSQL
jgi:hypothetical protein